MDKSELEKFIQQIVLRAKSGEQVEEGKIELKREWYKFESGGNVAESEFLKDLASIANTVGPEGYLIIGIDENDGSLWDSPLSQTKFKDLSNLRGLVVKGVDRPVDFHFQEIILSNGDENVTISVFVIPPSMEKPHIVKNFCDKNGKLTQNYIPVRKATSINSANRSDIELMYYDRKNIEREYALEVKTFNPNPIINSFQNELRIDFQISIANLGIKPTLLVEIKLLIANITDQDLPSKLELSLRSYTPNFSIKAEQYTLSSRFLKVAGNEVETVYCYFFAPLKNESVIKLRNYLQNNKGLYTFNVELTDINLKKYVSEDWKF